jgi:anti-anti-sigma factor
MAFSVNLEMAGDDARVTLSGELDAAVAGQFMELIEQAAAKQPKNLILYMGDLTFMASAGLRVLVFAKQKMGGGVKVYVIGAGGPVLNTLRMSGFHQAVYIQDQYPA